MDMSSPGIKNFAAVLLVCLVFACKEKRSGELRHKRMLYKKYSTQQVGYKEYMDVFNSVNDSIKKWVSNNLENYAIYKTYGWHLDSLICFNAEGDRCQMALSYQLPSNDDHDGMDYFSGIKIKNRWYFFMGGGHFLLPREYYQSDIHAPLSFKKLDEIAMEEIFRGYLKKNPKGEWEINDGFFTTYFEGSGWGDFEQQSYKDTVLNGKRFTNRKEYFNSIQLRKVKNNWLNEGRK